MVVKMYNINYSEDYIVQLIILSMNEAYSDIGSIASLKWDARVSILKNGDVDYQECEVIIDNFNTIDDGYYHTFTVTIGIEEKSLNQSNIFIKIGENDFINIEFGNGGYIYEINIPESINKKFKILSTKVERITRTTDLKISVV